MIPFAHQPIFHISPIPIPIPSPNLPHHQRKPKGKKKGKEQKHLPPPKSLPLNHNPLRPINPPTPRPVTTPNRNLLPARIIRISDPALTAIDTVRVRGDV